MIFFHSSSHIQQAFLVFKVDTRNVKRGPIKTVANVVFWRLFRRTHVNKNSIGLYREYAIAIENEGDSIRGNVYYVTMQITLPIPEFTRNERNFHCDVLHITPDRVVTLVLDDAIAAIQTSR